MDARFDVAFSSSLGRVRFTHFQIVRHTRNSSARARRRSLAYGSIQPTAQRGSLTL